MLLSLAKWTWTLTFGISVTLSHLTELSQGQGPALMFGDQSWSTFSFQNRTWKLQGPQKISGLKWSSSELPLLFFNKHGGWVSFSILRYKILQSPFGNLTCSTSPCFFTRSIIELNGLFKLPDGDPFIFFPLGKTIKSPIIPHAIPWNPLIFSWIHPVYDPNLDHHRFFVPFDQSCPIYGGFLT